MFFNRKYRNLYLLAIVFFLIGAVFHSLEVFFVYRAIRGVIQFTFAIIPLMVIKEEKPVFLPLYLLLSAVASFLTIGFEIAFLADLSIVFNALAYVFFAIAVYQQTDFRKVSKVLLAVFVLLLTINGYLCYEFSLVLEPYFNSQFTLWLVNIQTFIIISLLFLTLVYNYIHSNTYSWTLTLAVLAMFFSEVFRGMGYYDIIFPTVAVYLARILLLFSAFNIAVFLMEVSKKSKKDLF